MAHTEGGRRLTEQHRRAQVGLVARLSAWLRELFAEIVDPDDIAASSGRFVQAALPVVLETREMSRAMAEEYLDSFRRTELEALVYGLDDEDGTPLPLPDGTRIDMTPDEMRAALAAERTARERVTTREDVAQLRRELTSTAIAVHRAERNRGRSADDAIAKAADATAVRAARSVTDAGRAPLLDEVDEGHRRGAVGYARVVDADPCAFCAMLASRGPVYRSDAFDDVGPVFAGGNRFAAHDGCECTLEPVYGRRGGDLPPGSEELARQWVEVTGDRSDKWAAWRRWRESGTRPGEERVDAAERAETGSAMTPRGRAEAARRAEAKAERQEKWKSNRKPLTSMNSQELSNAIKGMTYRRHAYKDELGRLTRAGDLPDAPGRPSILTAKIDELTAQIEQAQELLPRRAAAEAALAESRRKASRRRR